MANDQHLGLDRSFLRGSPRLKLTFALAICFSVLSDGGQSRYLVLASTQGHGVSAAVMAPKFPEAFDARRPRDLRPRDAGGIINHPKAPAPPQPETNVSSKKGTHSPASLGLQVSGSQRYARPPLLEDTNDDGETSVVATPQRKKWDRNRSDGGEDREKSALGKFGDGAKAVFNGVMSAVTLASLLLAAETLWELRGTPLTLSNVVPTLTKLLPATGIGVFGAVQVVGLAARVVRVIVTLPIMLSGTWVILQNVPRLLPTGTDLKGAGALAALLATPEVLEAAAVVALIGGITLWAINFAATALGGVMPRRDASDDEEPG